jgi:quercetin dioxygenase-like cupin family protein
MRFVMAGVTADGRSTVSALHDLLAGPDVVLPNNVVRAPTAVDRMWQTDDVLRAIVVGRPDVALVDLHVGPGAATWFMTSFGPGRTSVYHRTDTVDVDIVVSGAVTLILDEEEVLLTSGDAVVLPGVGHAWRAGDDGYVMASLVIGAIPPEDRNDEAAK